MFEISEQANEFINRYRQAANPTFVPDTENQEQVKQYIASREAAVLDVAIHSFAVVFEKRMRELWIPGCHEPGFNRDILIKKMNEAGEQKDLYGILDGFCYTVMLSFSKLVKEK